MLSVAREQGIGLNLTLRCADECVEKNAEAAAKPKEAAGAEFEQLDLEYMTGVFVLPAGIMYASFSKQFIEGSLLSAH
jgi:hypothetical protein